MKSKGFKIDFWKDLSIVLRLEIKFYIEIFKKKIWKWVLKMLFEKKVYIMSVEKICHGFLKSFENGENYVS